MDKEYNYASANTSIAHTFGNATASISHMVRNLFPADYFKTINVATKVAHSYFDILSVKDKGEFIRKSKPYLIIRPRAEILSTDKFLDNTFLGTRMTNTFDGGDFGNLMNFISDPKLGYQCKYLMNRHRMSFDVSIIVESFMEQMNIANMLKNRVRWEMPMNLNFPMECQVPSSMIRGISDISGISMDDTPELLTYLNAHSAFPVTYKMKTSTGNEEFFRYYQAMVDGMFSNLSADDGSKKGFIDDTFAISFTIDIEFEGAGIYHLFSRDQDMIKKITYDTNDAFIADDGSVLDILYTQQDIFSDGLPVGWELYAAPVYKVEHSDKPDVIQLSDIMNNTILSVCEFQDMHNIDMSTIIDIKISMDGRDLVADKDYIIDYRKKRLVTLRVNKMSTYRILIHVNVAKINQLAIELLDKEQK